MYLCEVCHGDESREELVDEVLDVDGGYVLVCAVPSTVCSRCGERFFMSRNDREGAHSRQWRGSTDRVRHYAAIRIRVRQL